MASSSCTRGCPNWSDCSAGDRAVTESRKTFVPAWRRVTRGEPRWHVAIAVTIAIVLQGPLPGRLVLFRPTWLLPVLEAAMLVLLVALDPMRINRDSAVLRWLGLAVAGVISPGQRLVGGRSS